MRAEMPCRSPMAGWFSRSAGWVARPWTRKGAGTGRQIDRSGQPVRQINDGHDLATGRTESGLQVTGQFLKTRPPEWGGLVSLSYANPSVAVGGRASTSIRLCACIRPAVAPPGNVRSSHCPSRESPASIRVGYSPFGTGYPFQRQRSPRASSSWRWTFGT